jgi:hypothetical protein
LHSDRAFACRVSIKRINLTSRDNALHFFDSYFFSWLSLAAAIVIAAGWLLETHRDIRQPPLLRAKTRLWYAFAASTIIVMIASSGIYQMLECGDSPLKDSRARPLAGEQTLAFRWDSSVSCPVWQWPSP